MIRPAREGETIPDTDDPQTGHGKRLIGRTHEIARIHELLRDDRARVVTLTGPGGVGKTHLASTIAATWPGRSYVIELESVRDSESLLDLMAFRLGVRDGGEFSLLDQLTLVLDRQDTLLVLDNFEQIVESGTIIADLMNRSRNSRFLITSRIRLRISGEQVVPVMPLPVSRSLTSPAIELFVDRIRASDQTFTPDYEQLKVLTQICSRLDGLPLAIELAAARYPEYSLPELRDHLKQLLPTLSGGPEHVAARLQSLTGAIQWSYQLLSPAQQRLFRAVSVFHEGWSLETAHETFGSLTGSYESLLNDLAALVEHQLVVLDQQSVGTPRYAMRAAVHEFATMLLDQEAEAATLREMHALAFRRLAHDANLKFCGHVRDDQVWAMSWFEHERRNVVAALDWHLAHRQSEGALDIATSLSHYNYYRGHLREDRNALLAVIELAGAEVSEARAFALARLAVACWALEDHESCLRLGAESAEMARAVGSRWVEGVALNAIAESYQSTLRHQECIDVSARSAELLRDSHLAYEYCIALNDPGFAAGMLGQDELSERLLREGNECCQRTGHLMFLGVSLADQGILKIHQHDLLKAARLFVDACNTLFAERDTWYIARPLGGLATVLTEWGHPEFAAQLLGVSETCALHVGSSPHGIEWMQRADTVAKLEAALSPDRFRSIVEEGHSIPLGDAVAEINDFARDVLAVREQGASGGTLRDFDLTSRELDVLRLMPNLSDKEIAGELGISRRTVTTHVTRILSKMGADSRTEAVTLAFQHGLIQIDHQ